MKYIALGLLLCARMFAAEPPFDSADYVRKNADRLKDSSHVIQIAHISDGGDGGNSARWFHAYTAAGYDYTGSIPCYVPSDLVQRFARKFPTTQSQGRRIPTQPLKAVVRISADGPYMEVQWIHFTD